MAVYNVENHIQTAINSILAQTYKNFEFIIIDDGSTDLATITILDSLVGIQLVRQKNAGLPAARNAGFAAASGDFFLPLDADDWLEPDAIEKLLSGLKSDLGVAFAYSHLQLEGEACGVLAKSYNFFEQLFFNQMPYCLLLPRRVVEDVGGYDETMRKGYEDWEFNIRLGARGYFGHVVPHPLFHYRVSSSGMLISQSNRLHGELWGHIQQKHGGLYRMSRLIGLWRQWRIRPSTYPLVIYFAWLTAFRVLPGPWFDAIFRFLRKHSHSRRITVQNIGT